MSDPDETLRQIARCHQRQWPDEYGGTHVPAPAEDSLSPVQATAEVRRESEGLVTITVFSTWCDRCQCDHGPT